MSDTEEAAETADVAEPVTSDSTPRQFLHSLAGEWKGAAKTYYEPGVLGDESEWRGTIRPILGALYMLHEYEGNFDRTPHLGMAIIGYSDFYKRYEMAWVDTHHNGPAIMFSLGSAGSQRPSVLGSYPASDGSPDWGWRTELAVRDANTIVINAFNITPEGEEALAIETVYHRIGAEVK
jgi:hypothetical protein